MASRGPRRNRGRGQGRGNLLVEDPAPAPNPIHRNEDAATDPNATLFGEAVAAGSNLMHFNSTNRTDAQAAVSSQLVPEQDEVGSPFGSPVRSPASVPTETPAPTPARAPAQRLGSLGVMGRGGAGTRRGVGGRVMSGKVKPKAVRRDAEERARAEEEEKVRRRQRELQAQRDEGVPVNRYMRGGGRMRGSQKWGGRGRGDAMGRGWLDRNTKTLREATGLFGVAPAAAGKFASTGISTIGRAGAGGSTSTGSQNNTHSVMTSSNYNKVKQDPDILLHPTDDRPTRVRVRFEMQTLNVKQEIPEPVYPEEQEAGSRPAPRIDIEHINLVSDDEDQDDEDDDIVESGKGKGKERLIPAIAGMRPVRLQREEHKDRVAIVNTEPVATTLVNDAKDHRSSLEREEVLTPTENQDGDGVQPIRESTNWSRTWQDDEVEMKYDPTTSSDAMDVDSIAGINLKDKTSSVPVERRGHEQEPTISSSVGKDKLKPLQKSTNREKEPVLQTEEDRAEYLRHLEDVRILARELGGLQCSMAVEKNTGAIDLDAEMNDAQPRVKDNEGRLYLFQFPPVLPPLSSEVRREVTVGGFEPTEARPASETIDLTNSGPTEEIKEEPGLSTIFHAAPELVQEEGFIGKLVVRQSGKVELDWGGTILNLGRGAETEYLTTTVIIEGRGDVEAITEYASANTIGTGTGMGKVMGKFIATPDWEKLLEME